MSILELLRSAKSIAVVGLSSDPMRPSHGVAEYLQSQGYRIIPVNPGEPEVLGEKSYPDLDSIPQSVDIVDVFRRPQHAPEIVDAAVRIGAKAVWLQEGIVSDEAERRARAAGLEFIQDHCILKEHRKIRHQLRAAK